MKGDFSRFIFDPKKHYTSALMQQGRVLSDADWNTQQSINQYRFETEAQDVIGLCGVPEDVGGFEISLLSIGGINWDIAISPGRIYVDGILCELHESTSTPAIALDVNGEGDGVGIKVASSMPEGQLFQKYQWFEIFGTDLLAAQVPILEIDPTAGSLKFDAPVFRRDKDYVKSFNEAKDRRVHQITTYITQPDYPNPNFTAPSDDGNPPTLKLENDKTYLVYLDVWHLERTALDDLASGKLLWVVQIQLLACKPSGRLKLLEVALEAAAFDPNPTLNFLQSLREKLQSLAQERIRAGDRQAAGFITNIQQPITPFLSEFPNISVESRLERLRDLLESLQAGLESFIQVANDLGLPGLSELPAELSSIKAELANLAAPPKSSPCKLTYPEWDKLTSVSTGTLNARTKPLQSDDNPCLLSPTAGYQRLENQFYRVEIHQGGLFKSGSTDTVTFKWSRDNGSVVTAIEKISGKTITVQTVGPDDVLGFANAQWVEIIDDRLELNGQPGELIQIANVDPATRVITLQTSPTPLSTNPEGIDKVRHPKLRRWDSADAFSLSPGWVPLEGGIEVQLSEGTYKTGDYWLIPARTVTGEIEWPPYEVPNINPIPQLPLGIKHHYCRLAVLKFADQSLKILEDCRQLFPPLTKVKIDSGIHITEVSVLDVNNQPVPLKNDTEIPFNMLAQELRIVCDRPIDLQVFKSNNQLSQPHPAFFITVNLPFPTNDNDKRFWGVDLIFGYQPINLNAVTGINGNIIFWRPTTTVKEWLQRLRERLQDLPEFRDENVRILVNLSLKGNFIWAADDPKQYLDGEAFGTRDDETISNLRLPSGDSKRGGDFEMWFWLAPPPPPRLVDLQITPSTVEGGSPATGVVTLDKPAPEGGVEVSLISNNTDIARVPPSVTITAGTNSAEFTITTSSPGLNINVSVPITASLAEVSLPKVLLVKGGVLR